VLALHNYRRLPFAKMVRINQVGDNLVAVADFIPPDISAFADQRFRMAHAGRMRGCPVGFRPSPGFPPLRDAFEGLDYAKAELLEWSLVPVPSNASALCRGDKSVGARGHELTDEEAIGVASERPTLHGTKRRPRSER
jgi:hypothetical protein